MLFLSENDHIRILHFCLILEIERRRNSGIEVITYDENDVDEVISNFVNNFKTRKT